MRRRLFSTSPGQLFIVCDVLLRIFRLHPPMYVPGAGSTCLLASIPGLYGSGDGRWWEVLVDGEGEARQGRVKVQRASYFKLVWVMKGIQSEKTGRS
jgi:hypothetical protein